MMPTTCHDAFAAGQKQRLAHPLTSGAYKLRDASGEIKRMMDTMDAIGDHLRKPPSLRWSTISHGGCTTEDQAVYLKKIPTNIAHTMGWAVLPSIAMLTADGVPRAEVNAAVADARARVEGLLQKADIEHARLRRGIRGEYNAMRSGYSSLYGLLTDAQGIINDALARVEDRERNIFAPV